MMLEEPPLFTTGTILAGRYRLEREIGAGGVGVVVLASDLKRQNAPVAIKYLRHGKQAKPRSIERFKREAIMASKLRSDHVVRVLEVGELEDGVPYMVMDYLEGEDLSEVVRRGPVPIAQAVQWTLEACQALEEAHDLGIVHRDLKPANLFLARRSNAPPVVKILDFGISKILEGSSLPQMRAMTKKNETFGTPYYMSPEQLMSAQNANARSDIYSMGVCLYELLTGRLPFEGNDLRQLVSDVLSTEATPVRHYRPDIPVELADIIHACLSYEPTKRPHSVANLTLRMTPFASSRYVRQLATPPAAFEPKPFDFMHLPSPLPITPPPSAARSSLALFAAVGATSLVVGAALVVAVAQLVHF